MSLVALVKCDSYDYRQVFNSVLQGINLLGGIEKFACPNESILLKPNLLTGIDPDRCVTTHPNVFKAAAEVFKTSGATIHYGDNPGIISPFSAAKKSGLADIAKELNIDFADFKGTTKVYFKEGKQHKMFTIVNAVNETDGLISLPKFKTHGLTTISGCVKNQFGCLPFLQKRIMHAQLPNVDNFAKMLLDLNQCIKPRLYIMDSIYAMEGDGPLSGTPRRLNVIGFSSDPIALDSVMCRIIALEPCIVPTIFYGQQFGYGECEDDKIEIVGAKLENFITKDFKVERNHVKKQNKRSFLGNVLLSLKKKPTVIRKNCQQCGNCVLACPVTPKAIKLHEKTAGSFPTIDYDRCIRCYCCHEFCPSQAIKLKNSYHEYLPSKI